VTDIHAQLVAAVAEAKSPAAALRSVARVVAHGFRAASCLVLVRRKHDGLQPCAEFGDALAPPMLARANAVAHATLAEVLPVKGEAESAGFLAVPVAALDRAIGAVVLWRPATPSFTAEEVMRLSGAASQLVELIETAGVIETIGRRAQRQPGNVEDEATRPVQEQVLRAASASPGIAIGAATFRTAFPRARIRRDTPSTGPELEHARLRDALQKTRNDLDRLQSAAASAIGEEHALVFGAHRLLLEDPLVASLVDQRITAGRSAPVALDEALDEVVHGLVQTRDPYLRERIDDIEDLRSRILGYLLGAERPGGFDARVVVSTRLTPSLVVELQAGGAVGVASEIGGPTSHGALLARALGVPAVTGIENLIGEVFAGETLIVDGDDGLIVARPTPQTLAGYEQRMRSAEQHRTEFLRYRDEPAKTADDLRFELQANIALGADLAIARDNRAGGIGLYRTEFPFIVRDALPTVDEQVRIYAKAYRTFPDDPVTFRLLDLAGDKFLPSHTLGASGDAFHGYRSIRVLFDHPHVLRDQVQAFALAAGDRELRILIPMVCGVEEVVRIKQLVASSLAQGPPELASVRVVYGAMVETPAAVEIIPELATEVDFFSLGTNDLVQYTLVVDREDPRLSSPRHAYHPAIVRMIQRVVVQAHAAGKRVTVCGEMASRPDLAALLLAFGVDALSVTPRAIPELKRALAQLRIDALRARLPELLAIPDSEGVEAALRDYAFAHASGLPADQIE
jgi:phosphotransferase system enzyme I (PtsP)